MDRQQNIRIRIDDVELPMLVKNADEEKRYRDAAKLINDRMLSVRQKYPKVPNEKYYTAIVLLEIATKSVDESIEASVKPYKQAIAELQEEINAALKAHKA